MMLRNLYGRRVLVTPGWAHFASVAAERDQLKRDLEWTKRDLAMAQQSVREHRDTLNELLATRRAREMAEAELVRLYRERDLARARAAERDPNAALN
jgi:hypothetical protein